MNRYTHFEIPAADPEASMNFYKNVFGWKFTRWGNDEYWIAETGPADVPGINGAVMKHGHPEQPVVNTMDVEDLDATIAAIEKNGGRLLFLKYPFPPLAIWHILKIPEVTSPVS